MHIMEINSISCRWELKCTRFDVPVSYMDSLIPNGLFFNSYENEGTFFNNMKVLDITNKTFCNLYFLILLADFQVSNIWILNKCNKHLKHMPFLFSSMDIYYTYNHVLYFFFLWNFDSLVWIFGCLWKLIQ